MVECLLVCVCLMFFHDWSKFGLFGKNTRKMLCPSLCIKMFIILVCLITCDLVKSDVLFFYCIVIPFCMLAGQRLVGDRWRL